VLRRIFGPKEEEVIDKLQSAEFNYVYSTIKSRLVMWADNAACESLLGSSKYQNVMPIS
jgi:hypothetical protein